MPYNKTYKEVMSSRSNILELATLYQEAFNERLDVSCGNCISKGLEKYKEMAKKKSTPKVDDKKEVKVSEKLQFKLSVNSIREFGSGNTYTNETLTNEVAIAYLKKNEARKIQFSKLPSNIDELLK